MICIGYSPVEYEPAMWNSGNATLVHIDVLPAYEERNYTPDVELVGDIAGTLNKLAQNIDHRLVLSPQAAEILRDRQHQREPLDRRGAQLNQFALHPLRIVRAMQDIVNSDVTLTVDIGQLPYLDCPLPVQLPRPPGDDLQRPADHGRRPTPGHRRLAGQS